MVGTIYVEVLTEDGRKYSIEDIGILNLPFNQWTVQF